jgi:hypothetical protein
MSISSDLRSEKDARLVIFDHDGIGVRSATTKDLIAFAYDEWNVLYPDGLGIRYTDDDENDVAIHVDRDEVKQYLRETSAPKGICR